MTKELLPGLGSVALRELGQKINKAHEHLKEVSAKYNSDVAEAGDMGSVAHINGWSVRRAEDELHGLQQEAWKAVAEFAALSLSSPTEPSMASERTIAIRNAYERGKKDGLAAQASSEIREALRDAEYVLANAAVVVRGWAKESREGGWSTHQVKPNQDLADALGKAASRLTAALAPSRQGAAKRVEG